MEHVVQPEDWCWENVEDVDLTETSVESFEEYLQDEASAGHLLHFVSLLLEQLTKKVYPPYILPFDH